MKNRKDTPRGWRGGRRAFTLVELLVVISIIALLIAILLPSLKRARETAKRVACNANVRGIAQAGLTYATDDPNENGIPVHPFDLIPGINLLTYSYYGWGGKGGKGSGTATNNWNDSLFSGGKWMEASRRPLNNVIYKNGLKKYDANNTDWREDVELDLDLFHDPGDRAFPGMHYKGWKDTGYSSYDYFGTSYASNPLFVGVPGAGNPLQSNGVYLRPLSRVPNPANTIMYWENAARFAFFADNAKSNGGDYDQTGCFWPYRPEGLYTAHGSHGKDWHFNVAFTDGHSTFIKIKGSGRSEIPLQKMPQSCRPPNPSCECVFVRGLGWQLDTLPADLIETNKT
ncbi:MAG TPA: prepilin-type N-terminal cleavage/methylation domain-containing protein, partial [Phycisphaerae bacterium]|nr:prepilin-type N-terminal cleavage/methylation domain-containing protein [Phycisphaerae bacterium]